MNRDQLLRILAYHHTPFEGCDHEAVADDVMAALAAGGSDPAGTYGPAAFCGDESCSIPDPHPIHVAAGGSSTPATPPPADHIAIFDGPQRAAAESRLTEVRKFAELFGEVDGYLDRGFVRDTLLALLDGWIPPNPQLSDQGDDQ